MGEYRGTTSHRSGNGERAGAGGWVRRRARTGRGSRDAVRKGAAVEGKAPTRYDLLRSRATVACGYRIYFYETDARNSRALRIIVFP